MHILPLAIQIIFEPCKRKQFINNWKKFNERLKLLTIFVLNVLFLAPVNYLWADFKFYTSLYLKKHRLFLTRFDPPRSLSQFRWHRDTKKLFPWELLWSGFGLDNSDNWQIPYFLNKKLNRFFSGFFKIRIPEHCQLFRTLKAWITCCELLLYNFAM